MGRRAVRIARSVPDKTLVAALLAVMFAAILLLPVPAGAQEDEAATTMQAAEGTTVPADEKPAEENPETPAPAAKEENETANAQDASKESEREVQESGQQVQARATGSLANATATLRNDDTGNRIEGITIAAADCNPPRAANSSVTIRIAGEDGNVIISDADNEFEYNDQQIVIEPDDGEAIVTQGEDRLVTDEDTGTVVDSLGIVCSRDDDGSGDGNSAGIDDDELDCDVLLRRFRDDGAQYGDQSLFADGDVRDRIVVCLEQEVDQDTASDGDLPDTGGPSLIGLAVLGVVSALAGFSLVRGSRRED